MATTTYKTTAKKSIAPVEMTLTISASRINENGTFSGLTVVKAKGPNGTFKVSIPPQQGGAMYLKVESLDGLNILSDAASGNTPAAPKAKLF
jgi:hypothetical protein